jgi:Flp pilus assembly protein TadG
VHDASRDHHDDEQRQGLRVAEGVMRCDQPIGRPSVAADRTGNMMIEFAIALPVLLLLVVGLLDLGRFGLQKSALLQGARAGAQYGITSVAASGESTNINTTAQGATGLSGVTATNSVFCECVSGTTVACNSTCTGGGTPKRYVTVNTTKSFSSVVSVATLNLGSYGSWTPPTTVSASVTMIVP